LNYWQKPWTNEIRLKPINPKRISDQVFDQLRELIFRGDFQPGDKIMTERELAQALNVSRNSVREAINKLVTLRFLEQRQGQGTFVRSMDETVKIPLATVMETQDASLIDLLEMRMGIECNAASLAAQRANPTDLEAIEKAIGRWTPIPVPAGWALKEIFPFTWPSPWAPKIPCRSIS
jgi:GntR family transcriptional repressor for pyruvate dehydrogenase complex